MQLSRFESCINTLKKYDISAILYTKDVLLAQKSELEMEKQTVRSEVKKTAINAGSLNDIQRGVMEDINLNVIPKLQSSLKYQQDKSIYAEAKKITISRLIRKKQEIERCERTIAENLLRVKQIAKVLFSIVSEMDKIDEEINLMEDCILINSFFVNLRLEVVNIADFEVKRYHAIYSGRGGGV